MLTTMVNTPNEDALPAAPEVNRSSTPFRVLTLDGGGIRSIYTASVLHGLAAHFLPRQEGGWDIGRFFNLIAGTSTGGILACGLAAGIPTAKIVQIVEGIGPRLFSNPQPDSGLPLLLWAARCAGKAANSSEPLRSALEEGFGTKTIGDVYTDRGIALCVTAGRLLDWSPKVFKTPHFEHFTRDKDLSLVDVCLATSAAPIILPVATVVEGIHSDVSSNFVDGALWANNPSLIGLLEALDLCTDLETGKILRPIEILSIGTSGGAPGDASKNRVNRGLLDWGFGAGVVALSVELQDRASDYVMAKLVNHFQNHGVTIRYRRIPNPAISDEQASELKMDRANPATTRLLKQLGEKQAQFVQSECRKKTSLGRLITDIFSNSEAVTAQRPERGDKP
jgi:hypothetical protein